ncbi:borealin [Drosophila navojoa]|uniref:borealin n=1 Tax=Drosophila navojoa TaxID=7232 RepID=UPI0011BDCB21|nr:borealin [Drosophila navojoa]
MTRTKVAKRNRQQLREEAEREDQLRMAQMKLDSALEKIDELGKRTMQQVHNQLQLIVARTHDHVLHMKWSDFLHLNLQHFEDYRLGELTTRVDLASILAPIKAKDLKRLAAPPKTRSQSTARSSRLRTPQPQMPPLTRLQVQSVDRAVPQRADLPSMALLRWPKPGELALSTGGSPLAVQTFPERCANVQIPTKAGVLKLKPQKLSEVKREVLKQLDSATLNQIKTLNSNLHMIVDMANKLGKF